MWLDLASLGILVLLAWLGARKGALAAASGLVAIVGAYIAALSLAAPVAEHVKPMVGDRSYLALPLAGTLVFIAAFLLLSVIGTIASKLEASRREDDERSGSDRALGALFGFLRGALIVFLLGVLGLWLDAAREVGAMPSLPDLSGSTTAAVASSTIENGANLAMADGASPTARAAVQMMAHPKESITALRSLLEEPAIQNLIRDRVFWSHIEFGDIDAALDTEVFQEIARAPTTRGRFFALGLIDTQTAASESAFGDYFYNVLKEVSPRLQAIKNDPEFQNLMADRALAEAAQNGDTLALLTHPGFQRFIDRVLSGDLQVSAATPRTTPRAPQTQATPRRNTQIIVHDSMPTEGFESTTEPVASDPTLDEPSDESESEPDSPPPDDQEYVDEE